MTKIHYCIQAESKDSADNFPHCVNATITQQSSDLKSEISRELDLQLQPMASAVAKTESSIEHIQKDIAEVVEKLQATAYTWMITELERHRREAETGKTVSLDSPPFYTGPDGYKICMRVYLNGDGGREGFTPFSLLRTDERRV